ncbi:hypothetical protein SAMN02799631_03821 [Methylobacterium sp. 174MFSha1.1]|uniref:hypothetical protein n=1 Tax=Methylobacterium sp. 174MFSha1.1 TaxID=1502749 RepID=UPI0008E26F4F|nr:hypothetical protein [Methylobacterium sp. 174MFSha1.1]SFV01430.1 hypothetical protein SAMN02799631_03821 [Methylobacterium sp. 174MFSha1.1]
MRALTSYGLPRLGAGAALVAALFVTAAPQAQARDNVGAAIIGGAAAGVLGGVAAGAIMNGMQPPPPPPPAYAVPPPRRVYVEEPETVIVRPRRGPICHFERRKVWLDDESFTYKRVEVCE